MLKKLDGFGMRWQTRQTELDNRRRVGSAQPNEKFTKWSTINVLFTSVFDLGLLCPKP